MPDSEDQYYSDDWDNDINIKNFEEVTATSEDIMLIGYDRSLDKDIKISSKLLDPDKAKDYDNLVNKPQINGIELNKDFEIKGGNNVNIINNENSIIIDASGKETIITEKTEVIKDTSTLVLVKNKTFIPITSENVTDINVTVYATNMSKTIINKAKISFIAFKDKESGLIKTSEASNDITLIIGSQIIDSINVELNDDNTGIQIAVILNTDGYIWSSMRESIIEA